MDGSPIRKWSSCYYYQLIPPLSSLKTPTAHCLGHVHKQHMEPPFPPRRSTQTSELTEMTSMLSCDSYFCFDTYQDLWKVTIQRIYERARVCSLMCHPLSVCWECFLSPSVNDIVVRNVFPTRLVHSKYPKHTPPRKHLSLRTPFSLDAEKWYQFWGLHYYLVKVRN